MMSLIAIFYFILKFKQFKNAINANFVYFEKTLLRLLPKFTHF